MSSYISLCLFFEKLGMLVPFTVYSHLEKIWINFDIFLRVLTSPILKCGSGPPISLFPGKICLLYFVYFRKAKNIVSICIKNCMDSLSDVQSTM